MDQPNPDLQRRDIVAANADDAPTDDEIAVWAAEYARRRPVLHRPPIEVLTFDALCALRRALSEVAGLRVDVQALADRIEMLTTDLAEGELSEWRRLVARRLHRSGHGGAS